MPWLPGDTPWSREDQTERPYTSEERLWYLHHEGVQKAKENPKPQREVKWKTGGEGPHRRVSAEDKVEIVKEMQFLREEGMSQAEIANKTGFSTGTVSRWLNT